MNVYDLKFELGCIHFSDRVAAEGPSEAIKKSLAKANKDRYSDPECDLYEVNHLVKLDLILRNVTI